jgi:hypothetical protein
MKPPKTLIRIGVILLIVVAGVLVVRAVLNFTEGRALARALAELKAKGIPLTAQDLTPPCPDEDNGARLWRAFENTVTLPGRQTRVPGRSTPLDKADRQRSRAAAAAGMVISRAWTDFTAGKPLTPADTAALKDLILQNEKPLELVAEMGDKPCFLYRDPSQSLVESLLPTPVQMIQTTKLLFFSALLSAEDGDVNVAINKLITGLKFTPLAAREGTLIAFLISLADTRILSQALGEICRGKAMEDADLIRLMSIQDPGPWRERLAAAFRGERVLFIEVGGYSLKGSFEDLGSLFEGPSWGRNLGLWIIRPLLKRDVRRALPSFELLEAQAKVPYYQSRDVLRARDRQIKERPWYAILSKIVIGDSEAAFMKEAMLEAIMLTSRAGLACRLYKNRTGSYPESLDELVPGILTEVPIDPFTGKPLVYRREEKGFIVYSLGSNQKDDGGRSTYMITQLVMDKDDDWSWKEDR